MYLSDDELKTLWQQETKAGTRTACLSSDLLVRAGDGSLAAAEMSQVVNHIEHCADCAEEYRLAVAVRNWANEAANTHAEVFSSPATTTQVKEPWWQKFSMLNWKLPAYALGGLILLFAAWFIWRTASKKELQPEIANVPSTPLPTIITSPIASPLVTPSAAPEVPLVTQLQDGQRLIALNQQGELIGAENFSPTQQQLVKDALISQRIERSPLLAGLKRDGSALLSGSNDEIKFAVIAPLGKVLLTDRPTFRWSAVPNLTGYVVEVYDEQFNLIASSPSLNSTTWTIPQSLKRGVLYAWQVKASKDGQELIAPRPPAAQAKFRILTAAKASELAQARRHLSSSPLMLGLLYAEAGLLEEAEQEFRALQKANPTSPIARRLLANVRALQQ